MAKRARYRKSVCLPAGVLIFLLGAVAGWGTEVPPRTSSIPVQVQQIPTRPLPSPILAPKDTSAFNAKIIYAFNQKQCEGVANLITHELSFQMSPLSLAIAAYCTEAESTAESLFNAAEATEPSNEFIYLLHARYRWKRNPPSADALWEKVLMLAKSNSTTRIAKKFLQGKGDSTENLLLDPPFNYYLNLQLGPIYDSNPILLPPSSLAIRSSVGIASLLNLGMQKELGFGSIAADYVLTYNAYTASSRFDLLRHDLDIPVAFRAGSNEDLKIRAFGSYTLLGAANYYLLGGLGVVGVAYRGNYRQTVQGSVFQDRFFDANLQPQAGSHFRFDYVWEFYPVPWYAKLSLWVEHVAAARLKNPVDLSVLYYSHNDIGSEEYLEHNFKWMIAGLYARLLLREDDNASSYYLSSRPQVSQRRQDFTVAVGPSLTFPLTSRAQIVAFYRYSRRFSNFGTRDYFDATYSDHSTGVAFRVFLGNF